MAIDGERGLIKMVNVAANPAPSTAVIVVPQSPLNSCCSDFSVNVLADNTGLALNNDQSTIIHWYDPIVTGASMVLKKWVKNAWTTLATINNNTYGTFNAFGYYTNPEGQNFINFQIEWSAVLAAFGTGTYKVTTTYIPSIGAPVTIDSYDFCLKTYSAFNADNTVRLEWWISGVMGDISEDTKIKDFGALNVYNSLRLPGYFGYPDGTYEITNTPYNNGNQPYVEFTQEPIFYLKLRLLPFFIHEILRTNFMMADIRMITDYNSRNNGTFIQKQVNVNSGYKPKWYPLQSNYGTVELQFKQTYNRFRKLRN